MFHIHAWNMRAHLLTPEVKEQPKQWTEREESASKDLKTIQFNLLASVFLGCMWNGIIFTSIMQTYCSNWVINIVSSRKCISSYIKQINELKLELFPHAPYFLWKNNLVVKNLYPGKGFSLRLMGILTSSSAHTKNRV